MVLIFSRRSSPAHNLLLFMLSEDHVLLILIYLFFLVNLFMGMLYLFICFNFFFIELKTRFTMLLKNKHELNESKYTILLKKKKKEKG